MDKTLTREELIHDCAELRCDIEGIEDDGTVAEDYRKMSETELLRERAWLIELTYK